MEIYTVYLYNFTMMDNIIEILFKKPRKELLKDGKVLTDDNFYRVFICFLKENNAYLPYRNALKKRHGDFFYPMKKMPKRIYEEHGLDIKTIQESCAKEIINSSFTWSQTKQGHNFWGELYEIWLKFAKSIKIDIKDTF